MAAAAWPAPGQLARGPSPWLPIARGATVCQALPGQNTGEAVESALTAGAGSGPGWLASLDSSVGSWRCKTSGPLLALITIALLAGGRTLRTQRSRAAAAVPLRR